MTDGRKFVERNPEFIVGVDIAQVQLEDRHFLEELKELSEQTKFPLGNLCLELTKGCRMLDAALLKDVVFSLKEEGVRIIIDDFGSGVGSVDYLRELAPDYVKFDRKYIDGLTDKEEDRKIVQHLSELAVACGTKVCIKCVENEEIRDIVKQYRIQYLQGNYYSEAVSPGKLEVAE